MLRRHFPKGTNFDDVTDEAVQWVTNWLNKYPRKLLGWGNSQGLFDAAVACLAGG